MKKAAKKATRKTQIAGPEYSTLVGGVAALLETARRTSARAVNALIGNVLGDWASNR